MEWLPDRAPPEHDPHARTAAQPDLERPRNASIAPVLLHIDHDEQEGGRTALRREARTQPRARRQSEPALLEGVELAMVKREETGGHPAQRWYAYGD